MNQERKESASADRVEQDGQSTVGPGQDRPMSPWDAMRDRLNAVKADNVEECKALYGSLETARVALGLDKWSSLQAYFGKIPRCVKAVGGKAR